MNNIKLAQNRVDRLKKSTFKESKIVKKVVFSVVTASLIVSTNLKLEAKSSDVYKLDDIVISSTKTEHLVRDVPSTIQMVTSDEIKKMGATNAVDALSKVAGLETSIHRGAPNIRGLGFGYTAILINGRKPAMLESNHDGQGFILSTIDVNNIERIEVLRGQAGAMYGANALAGVINIITKKSHEFGGNVTVAGGNQEASIKAQIDTGRVGNFDAIFNAGFTKGIPEKESNIRNPSEWSSTDQGYLKNFNSDIGYHINDNNELRFILVYIDQKREERSSNTTPRVVNRENISVATQYSADVGEHSYTITPYYTESKNKTNLKEYSFKDFGVDGSDHWMLNNTNLISYGFEFLNSSIKHPNVKGDKNSITRGSLFIQDELSLFDEKLFVVPSLRYDQDTSFGSEVIPRLGITWHTFEGQRFKFNIGKGYLAPNLDQLYGDDILDHGISYTGNSDLKPEESIGWEIRYEADFAKVNSSIAYFEADIENRITGENTGEFDINGNPRAKYININDKVKSKGVELLSTYNITKNWRISGDYTWLDIVNEKTRDRLNWYSKQTFGLDLMYDDLQSGFSTNLWGKYNVDYTNENDGSNEFSFGILNFSARKSFTKSYTASFTVYNLLTTSRNELNNGPIDPLKWIISLEAKF